MAVATKIELSGRPLVAVTTDEDLTGLSAAELEAKLGELSEYLRSLPRSAKAPEPDPAPEPPPLSPEERAATAYAAVLAERAAGNGQAH